MKALLLLQVALRFRLFFYALFLWLLVPGKLRAQRGTVFTARGNETVLSFDFANDVFFKTDKYFTNGIGFNVYSDAFKGSFLQWCNVKTSGSTTDYYQGIGLSSNIYTPQNLNDTSAVQGDRPYAAYILFHVRGISNNKSKRYRLSSNLSIGLLGQIAQGKQLQSLAHQLPTNNQPLGWSNQLSNSLIINYKVQADYLALRKARFFEGFLSSAIEAGTLYNHAEVGYFIRFGALSPYLGSLGPCNQRNLSYRRQKRGQVFMRFGQNFRLVAYDGTLEGGIIKKNKDNYTLPGNEIKRQLWFTHAALVFAYRGFLLECRGDFVKKQFKGGTDHKWGTISLNIAF